MSYKEKTLTLIVPIYNEQARLSENVPQLISYIESWATGSRLIFVDDGSNDFTVAKIEAIISEYASICTSVEKRPHLGKGASVRYGLNMATTELAAFCDIDLSTPLEELSRLVELSSEIGGLAIGSRTLPGSRTVERGSLRREIAGRTFNSLVRALLCPGIYDTQCGAKAAPTQVWHEILRDSVENGFAWDVEILAKALGSAIKVLEVAVHWSHDSRSRVNVGRDGLRMLGAVFRLKFRLVYHRLRTNWATLT